MSVQLPNLPYALDALEPYMSRRTLEFHHGRHHKVYIDNTAAEVTGTELESADLVTIIRAAKTEGNQKLFRNSAQAWNHEFFWESMQPNGGQAPGGAIANIIERDLGGLDAFKKSIAAEAIGHFGSGWAWLVMKKGRLQVTSYHDADTPIAYNGITPLLTIDVWEHAYYLDYQNSRASFIDIFLKHLLNWEAVGRRLRGEAA